ARFFRPLRAGAVIAAGARGEDPKPTDAIPWVFAARRSLLDERDDPSPADGDAVPQNADVAVTGECQLQTDILGADVGHGAIAGNLQLCAGGVKRSLDRERAVALHVHFLVGVASLKERDALVDAVGGGREIDCALVVAGDVDFVIGAGTGVVNHDAAAR